MCILPAAHTQVMARGASGIAGVVMVGLVPTIQPSARSGALGVRDPREKPHNDSPQHREDENRLGECSAIEGANG
jgi:hypothetical protein